VDERKGGEQPEANDHSVNQTMLNPIRPRCIGEPAYLWRSHERKTVPVKGERNFRDLSISGEHSEQQIGMHRVVGDRMVGGRRPEELSRLKGHPLKRRLGTKCRIEFFVTGSE
jgi:hypothetical protein